jgi:hypothetical protein
MFTGNRGCLVDDRRELVRHHVGTSWITCVTEFRSRRHALDEPRCWTPLFFLDDAVALAAGHRPCGECRRAEYVAYRDAVTEAVGASERVSAPELNQRLAAERLRSGSRGLERAGDRPVWTTSLTSLPRGTVVVHGDDRRPHLVTGDGRMCPFSFQGWGPAVDAPAHTAVEVLTPRTSVVALRGGFTSVLHESAPRPHISTASTVHLTCR